MIQKKRWLFLIVCLASAFPMHAQKWVDLGASTRISSVVPADGFGGSTWQGTGIAAPYTSNTARVVDAWSGGVGRTKSGSEMMCVFGGGHNDDPDDSLYCIDLRTNTIARVFGPAGYDVGGGSADWGGCPVGLPDSGVVAPNAVHSTAGLVYISATDQIHKFNGALACGNGFHTNDTWLFSFSPGSWARQDPTNGTPLPCSTLIAVDGTCAGGDDFWTSDVYDPNSGLVFEALPVSGTIYVYSYNPSTNTESALLASAPGPDQATGDVDASRKLIVMFGEDLSGNPHLIHIDISTPSRPVISDVYGSSSGCAAPAGAVWPGVSYYSVDRLTYIWPKNSGGTYYTYNPDTKTCVTHALSGGPPNNASYPADAGVYGRFRCFASLKKCVVVNDATADAWALDLTAPSYCCKR